MAKKTRKARATASAWFDSFDPIDPPGWDDTDGMCRRHFAPVALIPDPAQRGEAERLTGLDLMGVFAAKLRAQVAPLPVPARLLGQLVGSLAPVCCYVGDDAMQAIVLAAIVTAAAGDGQRRQVV